MTLTLRKLSHAETARAFPRRGQTDVSEYVAALGALQVGDSAELELDGLPSRAAKLRLGLAATQVGFRLKWAPARVDDRLYFQVLPHVTSSGPTGSRQRTRPQARQPEARIPVASNPPATTSPTAPAHPRRRRAVRTS